MHTRVVHTKPLGPLTIRPLATGDTATVEALFDRLGVESRARRFNGAKPRLSSTELSQLALADSRHHSLVAYVEGDKQPAGIAQLVRDADDWTHAEIAFAVADCYHGCGIGGALGQLLAADARAAGITHLTATTQCSNSAARSLLRNLAQNVETRFQGSELEIVAALEAA
jgi:ribosomal protein S18 acetylase RimI-like enzyme